MRGELVDTPSLQMEQNKGEEEEESKKAENSSGEGGMFAAENVTNIGKKRPREQTFLQ